MQGQPLTQVAEASRQLRVGTVAKRQILINQAQAIIRQRQVHLRQI